MGGHLLGGGKVAPRLLIILIFLVSPKTGQHLGKLYLGFHDRVHMKMAPKFIFFSKLCMISRRMHSGREKPSGASVVCVLLNARLSKKLL